jgi:hypothetical protein
MQGMHCSGLKALTLFAGWLLVSAGCLSKQCVGMNCDASTQPATPDFDIYQFSPNLAAGSALPWPHVPQSDPPT